MEVEVVASKLAFGDSKDADPARHLSGQHTRILETVAHLPGMGTVLHWHSIANYQTDHVLGRRDSWDLSGCLTQYRQSSVVHGGL